MVFDIVNIRKISAFYIKCNELYYKEVNLKFIILNISNSQFSLQCILVIMFKDEFISDLVILHIRTKMRSSLYSRILIPDQLTGGEEYTFPGQAIEMGGKILKLEEQIDPRKSLNFHRGKCDNLQPKNLDSLKLLKYGQYSEFT